MAAPTIAATGKGTMAAIVLWQRLRRLLLERRP